VLASDEAPEAAPPDNATLTAGFLELARDSGWRFGQVVTLGPLPPLPMWRTLADALGAPLVASTGFDPATCPLVVAQRPPSLPLPALSPPLPAQQTAVGWSTTTRAVVEHATGLVFVLEHGTEAATAAPGADVIGVLVDSGGRRARKVNVAHALSEAQHPAGRLANRRLVRE